MMHDLGFQLSFAAVIGIGLFGQYAYHLTSKSQSRLMKSMIVSIGMTLGATVGTLPLCAWVFQSIPFDWSNSQYFGHTTAGDSGCSCIDVGIVGGIIEYSFVESVLFTLADACVELSMRCLEPLMVMPIPVAFDVLDVWLAFVCIIGCCNDLSGVSSLQESYF